MKRLAIEEMTAEQRKVYEVINGLYQKGTITLVDAVDVLKAAGIGE